MDNYRHDCINPGIARQPSHATRRYADRRDTSRERSPSQPVARGVLVPATAFREVVELIAQKMLTDETERRAFVLAPAPATRVTRRSKYWLRDFSACALLRNP